MADILPKSIILRSVASGSCAYCMNDNKDVLGFVRCGEDNVFNPFAKIDVEPSKFYSNYVHLIFPHSNKYWGRYGPDSKYIVASLDKPDENTSKLTCTLFEPSIGDDKYLYFTHVQSGWRVGADLLSSPYSSRVYVDEKGSASSPKEYAFTFLDWGTLVKLPKFITFIGDNEKYLKVVWYDGEPWKDGRPYLQFSGEDFNHEYVAYEVILHKDGHLRFKSPHVGKYWRRSSGSSSWILADSTDDYGNDAVNYVGTEGTCSVPFSYTQRDQRSSDGSIVTSNHIDGIFNGVNYYSFRFEQLAVERI